MRIYDRAVWELMHELANQLLVKEGDVVERAEVKAWFKSHYPLIKMNTIDRHLMRMSTNAVGRLHHHGKPGNDDLFFKLEKSTFRRYRPGIDQAPLWK